MIGTESVRLTKVAVRLVHATAAILALLWGSAPVLAQTQQEKELLVSICVSATPQSNGTNVWSQCPFPVFFGICFDQAQPYDYECAYALQFPQDAKIGLIPAFGSFVLPVLGIGAQQRACPAPSVPRLTAPIGIGPAIWSCS